MARRLLGKKRKKGGKSFFLTKKTVKMQDQVLPAEWLERISHIRCIW
jgi:hypothetical protein